MNTSTHAPSNSLTSQVAGPSGVQGKAYNPSTNDDGLRAEITAVLASTANGCLSELGYFPGIVPTLASVEREATLLKADNVKMFEDNRALAHLVSVQTDRINRDAERVAKYDDLKRRLNEVIHEREQLRQMVAISPSSEPTALNNLVDELERTKAELGNAMTQIKHLTAQLDQQHFLINTAGSSNSTFGRRHPGPSPPTQNTSLDSIPPTPISALGRATPPPATPAMSASGDLHGQPTSPMYSLVPMPPPPNLTQDSSTSNARAQSLPSTMKQESFSPVAPHEPLPMVSNITTRTESAPPSGMSVQSMTEGALVHGIGMEYTDAGTVTGPVNSPMDGSDATPMLGEPATLDLSAGMGDGEEEEEDDDDTDLAVDDDGLRSIDSCLSVLFEVVKNEPHKRICALCRMRYHRGAVEVDAVPYDNPERTELLNHAMTEHRNAWEKLRQEVGP